MTTRATTAAVTSRDTGPGAFDAIGRTWDRFWFTPVDSRPLAVVRIASAALALALWWSHADDLQAWFGPTGILPVDAVQEWRSPYGFSLFDRASTATAVTVLFGAVGTAGHGHPMCEHAVVGSDEHTGSSTDFNGNHAAVSGRTRVDGDEDDTLVEIRNGTRE